MNIKDLEYFHQLALEKNFSQVADHFEVSQPTITMAIKRLEQKYGLPLVMRDRSHQSVELTNFGQQFDQHVMIILREMLLAQREAKHERQETIRFGLPPIIGNYYFPSLVPNLLQRHLLGRLHMVEQGSNEVLKLLKNGRVDLALLGSLSPLKYDRLVASTIAEMPFGILVSNKNPLITKMKTGVSFRDLKGEKFVGLNERFIHNQAFHQMSHQAHIRPQVVYRTADVHVLGSLVAEDIGIAFLTSLAANINPGAVLIPLVDEEQPMFYISKVRRQQTVLDRYKKELWDQLSAGRPQY